LQPPVIRSVLIHGDGIAACCCAQLLRTNGVPVATTRADRPRLPSLLLGENTQALLSDVFESQELFADAHQIRKRIVAWGPNAEPIVLPHSAKVVSEKDLLDRLWSRIPTSSISESVNADWTIHSSRDDHFASFPEIHLGLRVARASSVLLKASSDQDACWIESAETGWLFLLPTGRGSGSLISVGEGFHPLLGRSRLIQDQIESLTGPISQFSAYPRMLSTLCGERWLACGTAAISFDPLCGEGAGNAVREAILAAAVIRAISARFAVAELLALYSSRLTIGFLRHLEICQDFYRSGGDSPFWKAELDQLRKGIRSIRSRVSSVPQPQYQLVGFELRRGATVESRGLERAALQ
jgi:hypothetical protein